MKPNTIPSASPALHYQEADSFHDQVAEQLRRAPWLMLSMVTHGVAILLIYLLAPPPEVAKVERTVSMEALEQIDDVEPDDPIEPPEVTPPEEETPEFVENPSDVKSEDMVDTPVESDTPSEVESAFEHDSWNTAIGHGGAAGGQKYGGRFGDGPGRRRPTKPIVDRALQWLAKHQDESGRWDCDGFMKHDVGRKCTGAGNAIHDVGVTGLALLAFLGEGNTMRSGHYREHLKRGVKWLIKQQREDGLFGTNASSDFVYDHCIAALAMCEAYGLSHYISLRKYAQRGLNYLEKHRNPYSVWRYQPRDNDNDTSVTGWAFLVYKSGKDFKLQVNDKAFDLTNDWLDQMTDPTTGRCGYNKRGGLSSRQAGDHSVRFPPQKGEALTAVGLMCRFFLGQNPKKTPVMQAAADTILNKPPTWESGGSIDHYYWYYGTYAMYHYGGKHWKQWSRKMTHAVVKQQRDDGNYKGSWDPSGAWGEDGGRVYSTAILALTLQAYYRYGRVLLR